MSGDKTEDALGCLMCIAVLILFIPVIGPFIGTAILIILALILITYQIIKQISKNIKSSNRRREMLLNEKQKESDFRGSVNLSGEEKAITKKIANHVEITGSTKESNIIPKQQKNRKKIICNNCGALFEEYSLNCAYCGGELKIKKYKGIKRRLL